VSYSFGFDNALLAEISKIVTERKKKKMKEITLNGEKYVNLDQYISELTTVNLDGELYFKVEEPPAPEPELPNYGVIIDGDGDFWSRDPDNREMWRMLRPTGRATKTREQLSTQYQIVREL
jgi:hypothetical protein